MTMSPLYPCGIVYTGIVEPLFTIEKLFTQVLLSPTFDTVVLSGVVLDLQTSTSCKSSKIVLLESSQIAALIPQADHSLQSWAGRTLKNSLAVSLKRWSSRRSMIWLHNICVTSSRKTQHAPPATFGTLRLI